MSEGLTILPGPTRRRRLLRAEVRLIFLDEDGTEMNETPSQPIIVRGHMFGDFIAPGGPLVVAIADAIAGYEGA